MADKENVQVVVKIPKYFGERERIAIAAEVIDFIRNRTESGKDINHNAFKKYSKSYKDSLNFKVGDKTGKVNLSLSGDMLAAMTLVDHKPGAIVVGYDTSDPEADIAEGNQIGSYGQPNANPSKARKFIGINPDDLKKILNKFKKDPDLAEKILAQDREARDLLDDVEEQDER